MFERVAPSARWIDWSAAASALVLVRKRAPPSATTTTSAEATKTLTPILLSASNISSGVPSGRRGARTC